MKSSLTRVSSPSLLSGWYMCWVENVSLLPCSLVLRQASSVLAQCVRVWLLDLG